MDRIKNGINIIWTILWEVEKGKPYYFSSPGKDLLERCFIRAFSTVNKSWQFKFFRTMRVKVGVC